MSKRRYIYTLCAIVVFSSIYVIFATYSHTTPIIMNGTNEIRFSHESGFYNAEFDLRITSDRGDIYYTLDGSEPTCESIRYDGPIHIYNASENENVYSSRDDVSTGFYQDLMEVYCESYDYDPKYSIPDFLVDKCTIVRAIIYYGDDKYSKISTASYFVGDDITTKYQDTNIISIVTDPKNLFDYNDGIYVTGSTFDNFLVSELDTFHFQKYWWWWRGNYSLRGMEAEREVCCQILNDGILKLSQDCGIRIHGGGTRGKNQKSLNLYARETYDGVGHFGLDFWGNGYYAKRLTLFQGGDDDITKSQDYFMNCLVDDLNVSTMDFIPYVVFIDGEYWGVYWLTEKYDEEYIHYHYNVLPDNVVIIKNGYLEVGEESDYQDFQDFIWFCENADFRVQNNIDQFYSMVDVDSFLDYYASMIYIGRYSDWPAGNYAIWKSRKAGEGDYNDSKWRWMVFDVNSGGMYSDIVELDSYELAMGYKPFSNLMKNYTLRNMLMDRIEELAETNFSANNVRNVLCDYHSSVDSLMYDNCRRFWGEDMYSTYSDRISGIEYFLNNRNRYINDLVEKHR